MGDSIDEVAANEASPASHEDILARQVHAGQSLNLLDFRFCPSRRDVVIDDKAPLTHWTGRRSGFGFPILESLDRAKTSDPFSPQASGTRTRNRCGHSLPPGSVSREPNKQAEVQK